MRYNTLLKVVGILTVATALVGVFWAFPNESGLRATDYPGDIAVDISGPSSGSVNQSGTYTGVITWTGSAPPFAIGKNSYEYEFTATSPSGTKHSSGTFDTSSTDSTKSFTHSFNFSEGGTWKVCFTGALIFNGGPLVKTDCINVSVSGGNQPGPNPDPDPGFEQVSVHIEANPEVIFRGDSSLLTWNSNNAFHCTASGGWIGTKPLNGSQSVSPQITTTFTIRCFNQHDSATDSVTVVVKDRQQPPHQDEICGDGIDNDGDGLIDENCPVDTQPEVTITANPSTIQRGQSSTLTWNSARATSCSINQGIGSVSLNGSRVVSPQNTTTYTITCTDNDGDRATDSATVHVQTPQQIFPTVNIDANPRTIFRGDNSTLVWSSQNATQCTATGGWSGSKALSGQQVVSPNTDTTYIITCTNQHGSDTDNVTVFVKARPVVNMPTVDITANPQNIRKGETSRLSWVSQNANNCVASNGWSGQKSLNGHQTVQPNRDTTYVITCTNQHGSATDSVTVFVRAQDKPDRPDRDNRAPEVDIDANPRSIDEGENSILFWNSQRADRCVASNGWSGNVALNGSRTVSPNRDTTYVITCTNQHGSATDSVTVFVDEEDDDDDFKRVDVDLKANPDRIFRGQHVVLRWDSKNADYCRAFGDWSGTLSRDGSRVVSPTRDSTYKITCYNNNDSDSDTENVDVITATQPPIFQPPIITPPVVHPPVVYPPSVKPPVVRTPMKDACDCECGCSGINGGITINNTNTINLACSDGVCRPVTEGDMAGLYSNSDRDRDDDGNGFLASISGSGIAKGLGYIFLFLVGILLLGILVYIILELVRAMTRRNQEAY